MRDDAEDVDHLFELWGDEERKRGDPEEHPSPERLTAYQAGELSPEEDEKIQEHLAACRECAMLLLELEEFLKPPEARPYDVADFEAAAGWRRLGERMGEEISEARLAPSGSGRFFPFRRVAGLAAAALFAGVLIGGLGGRLIDRDDFAAVSRYTTLRASGAVRGGGEGEDLQEVRLPTVLELRSRDQNPRSRYRLELLDAQGRVLRSEVAPGSEDPEVLVVLKEGFLKPGVYTIRLLSGDGRSEEELGRYPFRIAAR